MLRLFAICNFSIAPFHTDSQQIADQSAGLPIPDRMDYTFNMSPLKETQIRRPRAVHAVNPMSRLDREYSQSRMTTRHAGNDCDEGYVPVPVEKITWRNKITKITTAYVVW